MKPNKYIKNTGYATIAELGTLDLSITVPANVNAHTLVENVVTVPYDNPIIRFSLSGVQITGSSDFITIVDGVGSLFRNLRQYPTTIGSISVGVYRKGRNRISLYYSVNNYDMIGSNSNYVTAHITMFQSPFEA